MTGFLMILFALFGVPVVCWMAVRAARDMDARGEPGWIYGLLILGAFPIGVLAWLAGRAKKPLPE